MEQAEIHHDGAELVALEWQRLGVALQELERRDAFVAPPGFFHHQWRKIDAHDGGTSCGGGPGSVPRPRRDVEHSHPGLHTHGFQKRVDGQCREGAERVGVEG